MNEAEFLGALLPSHPDYLPIIEAIREKYKLPVKYPDDDPIEEIYFEDRIVSFEEFRQEIKDRILENINTLFPENFVKQYQQSKNLVGVNSIPELDRIPDDLKPAVESFVKLAKQMAEPNYQILNFQIESITDMLYIYLLTGETHEAPSDWFGKVVTSKMSDETVIFAVAGELTNIDEFTKQIRQQYDKTFGQVVRRKLTKTAVSTAYYMQLQRANVSWRFIVDEFIRRNNISMPLQKNSQRYAIIWRKNEARLKKRMQRTEKILDVIVRDKK